MIVRLLIAALVALVLLPMAWRMSQSPAVKDWLKPAAPAKPFQFDNGSVRQPAVPASSAAAEIRPGLKKCRQGERVIYTDGPCPRGTQAQAFGGVVNVLESGVRAPTSTPEAPAPRRLPSVRDVMTDPATPTLREQHIERAANSR